MKYKEKHVLPTILVLIFLTVAVSATEHLISLQGYASDSSDNPLSTGDISVRIYDNSSGGSLVYDSGDDFNDTIADGIYDILLGSNTSLDLDNTKKYHMEIDINGGEVVGDATSGRQAFWPGGGDHSLPTGVIVMWSGNLTSIPDGWALCDGTQGSPDLRDRFVYGVSTGENPGATGGSDTNHLTISQMPSHRHVGTTNSAGNHRHDIDIAYLGGGTTYIAKAVMDTAIAQARTEYAGEHTHSFTTSYEGGNSPIDNRPAYFKLAFIMKI